MMVRLRTSLRAGIGVINPPYGRSGYNSCTQRQTRLLASSSCRHSVYSHAVRLAWAVARTWRSCKQADGLAAYPVSSVHSASWGTIAAGVG